MRGCVGACGWAWVGVGACGWVGEWAWGRVSDWVRQRVQRVQRVQRGQHGQLVRLAKVRHLFEQRAPRFTARFERARVGLNEVGGLKVV